MLIGCNKYDKSYNCNSDFFQPTQTTYYLLFQIINIIVSKYWYYKSIDLIKIQYNIIFKKINYELSNHFVCGRIIYLLKFRF